MTTSNARRAAALAFSQKLNEILATKNMKRRELARRLAARTGVSFETARTNVHRLLRGTHYPNDSTRRDIAACLEIDPGEFEEAALSGDPFRGRGQSAAGGSSGSRTEGSPGGVRASGGRAVKDAA